MLPKQVHSTALKPPQSRERFAMVISSCDHYETRKNGKDHLGNPRVRCVLCGKSWIDRSHRPLGDLRIQMDRAVLVLKLMLEGMSISAIHRLTGVSLETIEARCS